MTLLFVGDVVGRAGRTLLRRALPALVQRHGVDLVVANGENAAGGAGITREVARELFSAGVDVLTSGNHVWDKRETLHFIASEPRLLRPANFPAGAPGSGSHVCDARDGSRVGVINVMGRVFMAPLDNPFEVVSREIARVRDAGARVVLVDFHAEATSEKLAMGWHCAGTVSAVVGTHTHVQTADERLLPGGTAYLTDVGMTGPHDGVIGMDRVGAVARFVTGLPAKYGSATGDERLHGVVIDADPLTGHARRIERLSLAADEVAGLAAAADERPS